MKAIEAKVKTEDYIKKLDEDDLGYIFGKITEAINEGVFFIYVEIERNSVIDKLRALGYEVDSVGETKCKISWRDAVADQLDVLTNMCDARIDLIGRLSKLYEGTVSFVKDTDITFISGFNQNPYDIIVFEEGVRGPADWLYLNEDNRWAHGGYTGYKDTYDDVELSMYIKKVHENNLKYNEVK